MTSGISFHILYDAIDNDPNPTRALIERFQPRIINVVGGARKSQAFTFAKELHAKYPAMRVIWRSWPDDGNHDKEQYKLRFHRGASGELIIDDDTGCKRWVSDNEDALTAGLTVLTDNESIRTDLDVYAEWQAKVMDLVGDKGWKVAVGRFATGNPTETQYQQLDKMFETLNKWDDLHCFSPNEYMSNSPSKNGGNVKRYELAINRAKQIGAWPFPVNIGEFGILVMESSGRLDPDAGYRDSKVGFSSKQAARFTIDQWKTWYQPNDIDVCIYCIGGDGTSKWDRCRIDTDPDFIKELIVALDNGELAPMGIHALPQSVSKPANAGTGRKVICRKFRNIRSGPSTRHHDDGDLPIGAVATVFDTAPVAEKIADGSTVNWWWMESEQGNGWIQSTGWAFENVPTTAELKPLPEVIPPPPQETITDVAQLPPVPSVTLKTWTFGFEMVGTEEQKTAIERGLELMVAGMAWIGQAAGTSVTIKAREVVT